VETVSLVPVAWNKRWRLWIWRHRQAVIAYSILAPMFVYFVLFTWVPVLVLAGFSLTEWNVIQWPPKFVGLSNYIRFFTDPYYHKVILNTIVFASAIILINLSLGFLIAVLLNERIFGRSFYRTVWYLPVVISGAVMAQVLVVFLHPASFGVLNSVIGIFGLQPVIWTRSEFWMPFWVVVFSIWRSIGAVVIFFLAGLQSIDSSLYEAARVDGASSFQLFRHITVPLMAPVTLFVFITQMLYGLQIWEAPLILTFGGPFNSTRTMVYSIYSDAFANLTVGLAASESIVLLLVLMCLSAVNLRLFYANRS
jgi:ABC-type sugar transport system permease subunit